MVDRQCDRCQYEKVRIEVGMQCHMQLAPEHQDAHHNEYRQWDVAYQVDESRAEPTHGAHRGDTKQREDDAECEGKESGPKRQSKVGPEPLQNWILLKQKENIFHSRLPNGVS